MTKSPELGKPVKRGAGWFVPSGKVGYFVEWVREGHIGRWRCTCPGYRRLMSGVTTPKVCKHIRCVIEH